MGTSAQRISRAGQTRWEHDAWGSFSTMIRTLSSSVTGETGGHVFESGIDAYHAEQIYLRKLRAKDGGLAYRVNVPGYVGEQSPGPIAFASGADVLVTWSGGGENSREVDGDTTEVVLADGATGAPHFRVSLVAKRTDVEALVEPGAPVEFCGMTYPADQQATRVVCRHKEVVDLRPLARLPNLETLWLAHTHVADLSAIAELPSLRSLRLEHCEINNLTALSGLTNLQELFLAGNEFQSLKPLGSLKNLKELDLSDNPSVASLAPLSELPSLSRLSLRNARELDLSPHSSQLNSDSHWRLTRRYRLFWRRTSHG